MDEHTLNDLLECSVCLERLDTSSKVLPCQHTFCRKCLEVIVSSRQELRCPECRVLVEVKIDDLPPNVLLMRILEGMKNAAAAAKSHQTHQQQKLQHSKTNHDVRHASDDQQQQNMRTQLQVQQNNQSRQQHYQTNASQQQQQRQSQPNAVNQNSISIAQHQFMQQRRCLLPHAYALYDFESTEPTDLHFKKGDLVLLKRKVDSNWYVGQLNNGNGAISEGTFPINHVQVIVPLPTPQCIALYDFKMPPNEEQGCLTFKKGTAIHVLRRVDHNWAEGCIGTTIGIFPIAFVELNALAKQVLHSYLVANTPTTLSLTSPPIMPLRATVTAPSSVTTAGTTTNVLLNQLRNPPPMPITDINNSDATTSSSPSSNSSSNATSPHLISTTTTTATSSASGPISTSMPSSPNQSLLSSPQHEVTNINVGSGSSSVRFRDKREKRHSLNALLSAGTGLGTGAALSILQSNRHSAEILSIPNDPQTAGVLTGSSSGDNALNGSANARSTAVPQTTIACEQQHQLAQSQEIQLNQQQQQQQHSHQRVNVLKTSIVQHAPPTLPWGYLALYPYKPRKSDELELKKGCVYIVTERCLDGWFKGKNWQDITGVFPGNYATPLRSRDQQQLMHQWKYVPLQSAQFFNQGNITLTSNNNCLSIQAPPALASTSTQRIQNLHQPPDLPPRQVNSTSPLSSVWTKPLGHTVEAFFNRYSKPQDVPSKDQKDKDKDLAGMQKENKCGPFSSAPPIPSTSASTTSSAVQLMKRLAHIKSRSKSPNSAMVCQQQKSPQSQLAQDKPPIDDTAPNFKSSGGHSIQKNNSQFNSTVTAHGQLHPVHVRSGSCPSQLLQSLPHDQTAQPTSATMVQIQETVHKISQQQNHQRNMPQISPHASGYGSQQLRGPKDRPHLQSARQSMDASTLRSFYNSAAAQQQQQNSVNLSNNCGEQRKQQPHTSNALISNHRKSHSLDAGAILTRSNIDCGSTNGSNGGVSALIAPSNITVAAVAASATTKSTQNSRERKRERKQNSLPRR
ncbi:E3 ubiquitin-protein ligase SH3RF1 isoform X2 [Eurosta solidaginis]|uniref:E3 ubiquitin-protein ligase SH3RF1 isoform X2 n=1 Tax=Eurosta solidaginis TaxID=178769 RepID=UPI0035310BB4